MDTFGCVKRKKPFTEAEKKLLRLLMRSYAHKIDTVKIDSKSNREKTLAWQRVTQEFNNSKLVQEKVTVKQVRKYWQNNKSNRIFQLKQHQSLCTESDSSELNQEDPYVTVVLSQSLPTIKPDDLESVKDFDSNDSSTWPHVNQNKEKLSTSIQLEGASKEINPIEDFEYNTAKSDSILFIEGNPQESNVSAGEQFAYHHSNATRPESIELINEQLLLEDRRYKEKKNCIELESLKTKYQYEHQFLKQKYEIDLQHQKTMNRLKEKEQELKVMLLEKQLNDDYK